MTTAFLLPQKHFENCGEGFYAPCPLFPGTATSTFPARRTSTGRPGRHGNAARWLAEEASNHVAEPARTATTVPGVVRYVERRQPSS